jgi:hypothetical protein
LISKPLLRGLTVKQRLNLSAGGAIYRYVDRRKLEAGEAPPSRTGKKQRVWTGGSSMWVTAHGHVPVRKKGSKKRF